MDRSASTRSTRRQSEKYFPNGVVVRESMSSRASASGPEWQSIQYVAVSSRNGCSLSGVAWTVGVATEASSANVLCGVKEDTSTATAMCFATFNAPWECMSRLRVSHRKRRFATGFSTTEILGGTTRRRLASDRFCVTLAGGVHRLPKNSRDILPTRVHYSYVRFAGDVATNAVTSGQ